MTPYLNTNTSAPSFLAAALREKQVKGHDAKWEIPSGRSLHTAK